MTAAVARPHYIPMTFGATWRQRLGFVVAIIVAIVALSELTVRRVPTRTLSGTLIEYLPNEAIGLGGDALDPNGVRMSLRERTRFEGFPTSEAGPVLTPGARVEVSYRTVGERRPVAVRVRRLDDVAR